MKRIYVGILYVLIFAPVAVYFASITRSPVLAQPSEPDTGALVANNTVRAILHDDATGITYLGGDFTEIGNALGSAIPVKASTSLVIAPHVSFVGPTFAIIPDGFGGWYMGGWFSNVAGVAQNNIAHINAAGGLEAGWDQPNGYVKTMALSGTTLYVGGSFTDVGGTVRNNLAAYDVTTGQITGWDPNADGTVNDIEVSGAFVYVGGTFTAITAVPRNGLAALDTVAGLATPWDPNPDTANIKVIEIDGDTIYIGGDFDNIGGSVRNNLAAVSRLNGLTTGWSANTNAEVSTLKLTGPTLYAGGSFTNIGGELRNYIAALDKTDLDGNPVDADWNPDANGSVESMNIVVATLYVGGQFTIIGGQSRSHLAALEDVNIGDFTGDATAWNPHANDSVETIAIDGDTVYIGGTDLSSVNAVTRNRLAAIDADGVLTTWDPNVNDATGSVRALALDGTTLYVGGDFDNVGGSARFNIAALDTLIDTNNAVAGWGRVVEGPVYALAVDATRLYVGGDFGAIDAMPDRSNLAAITKATGALDPWTVPVPAPAAVVYALSLNGPTLFVGGDFGTIDGNARSYGAAVDTATETVEVWNPGLGANGAIRALVNDGVTIYAGGDFTVMDGLTVRNHLAQLTTDPDAVDPLLPWNPNVNNPVFALALSPAYVYAGGDLTIVNGGTSRNDAAAFDRGDALATDWNPNFNNRVYALAVDGSTVYVGGGFTRVGTDAPQTYFAQFGPVTVGFSSALSSGDEGVTPANLEVSLSDASGFDVDIDYIVSGGTADEGVDFTLDFPQTVTILAGELSANIPITIIDDLILEDPNETIIIELTATTDAELGAPANLVHTYTILDNDSPAVFVTESGGTTDVTEGGATDTYEVVLQTEPTDDVVITITVDADVETDVAELTFTTLNWDTPQTVTVTAVDDAILEDAHTGTITHTAMSVDLVYDGIAIDDVVANITDNDIQDEPQYLASDLLGQLDIGDEPVYTQNVANNGDDVGFPNDRGFDIAAMVEMDPTGHRLFVSDYNNNRVLVFNLDANNELLDRVADVVLGQNDFVSDGVGTTDSSFNAPIGMAFDDINDRLFVVDQANNRVMVFDLSDGLDDGEAAVNVLGQADFVSAGFATTATGMNAPQAMAYDSVNERLFVSEVDNHRVTVFDLSDGIDDGEAAVNVLGQANFGTSLIGVTATTMDSPFGLEINSAGDTLFVGDEANNRVLVFDLSDGIVNGEAAVNVLGQADFVSNDPGPTQAQPFSATIPELDEENNRLFLTEFDGMRVTVFDIEEIINGEDAVAVLGQPFYNSSDIGITQARFDSPAGILLEPENGNLYIADAFNNRVMIFELVRVTNDTFLDGEDGSVYSDFVDTSGSQGTLEFTLLAGALPDGLVLDADTGEISGTPTVADAFDFTIRVTDTGDWGEFVDEQDFTLTIDDDGGGGGGGGGGGIIISPTPITTLTRAQANALLPAGYFVDDLIKLPDDGDPNTFTDTTVYYIGMDAKRHPFPGEKIYFTWYSDFGAVRLIDMATVSQIPLGTPILPRPGSSLVKIQSDPKTYYIEPGSYLLRWVENEETARTLGGADWNKNVIDVEPTYWNKFALGASINLTTLLGDWPEASLMKTSSSADVYYITETGRRRFVDWNSFIANFFQARFIQESSASGWLSLPVESAISGFEDALFTLQH